MLFRSTDDLDQKDSKLGKEERSKLERELESLAKERAKLDAKMQSLRSKLGKGKFIYKTITVDPKGRGLIAPNGGSGLLFAQPGEERRIRIEKLLDEKKAAEDLNGHLFVSPETDENVVIVRPNGERSIRIEKHLDGKLLEGQKLEDLKKEMKELRIELKDIEGSSPNLLVVPKFRDEFKRELIVPKVDAFLYKGFTKDGFFEGANGEEWKAWNQEYAKAMKEWSEQFHKAMQEIGRAHV